MNPTTTIAPSELSTILQRARADGLRDETLQVLCLLAEHGSARMTDLATHLRVSTAAMTAIIDSLERRSFVRRNPSTTDRRVIPIHLQSLGRLSLENILES